MYYYGARYLDPDGREVDETPAFTFITPLLPQNTDTVECPKNKLGEVRFAVATVELHIEK